MSSRILALVTLAAIPGIASAQVLQFHVGTGSSDELGSALTGLGDIDGDGRDDFAAAAPGRRRVNLYSGATGASAGFVQTGANNGFGRDVCGLGDVGNDGFGDFAVGAWLADIGGNNTGRVTVYSGRMLDVLYNVPGPVIDGVFGYRVVNVGDVDGDGVDDWAGGSPNAPSATPGSGLITVHSGVDGALVRSIFREPGDRSFGRQFAPAGDVDGDGTPDLLVGLEFDETNGTDAGAVRVISLATGATIRDHFGSHAGDHFGRGLDTVGDVDGDGRPEYAIGASGFDGPGNLAGRVRLYRASDGTVMRGFLGWEPIDALGDTVEGIDDVDGDGIDDVAMTGGLSDIAGNRFAYVRVHSSATGQLLRLWYGDERAARFGLALADAGDLDGDGVGDLLVGAPGRGNAVSAPSFGAVWAYSGSTLDFEVTCLADGVGVTCPCGNDDAEGDGGCRNSTGRGGTLSLTGSSSLANADLGANVIDVASETGLLFVMGLGTGEVTVGNGTLCTGTPIQRLVSYSAQENGYGIIAPGIPTGTYPAIGLTTTVQVVYRDVGGPCGGTVNATNAVRVTWRP